MGRVCVIDIAGLSCRVLRGRGELWINRLPGSPRPISATLPATTASVQASMTTGVEPGVHGVIGGGIYRRQAKALSFEERSNTLLSKKRFWHSQHLPARPKVALVFWSNPLAGAADVVLGANTYCGMSRAVVEHPVGLRDELKDALGAMDASLLCGPGASDRVSGAIAAAAEQIWLRRRPDLQWVYLPGLNFEIVRHGLDSPEAEAALVRIDALARRLAEAVSGAGGETFIVSSGGYVPVSRVAFPNVRLAEAGMLKVTRGEGGPRLDLVGSRAFAVVDHQVAHLFCLDESSADEAADVVAADPAVAVVRHRDELIAPGLGRDRAGERIALAAPDAWFDYRWWTEQSEAPAGAVQVGDPGKCGYDPCELFAGGEPGTIDPDPARVKASRGLLDVDPDDQCVLAATCEPAISAAQKVTDLPAILSSILF